MTTEEARKILQEVYRIERIEALNMAIYALEQSKENEE